MANVINGALFCCQRHSHPDKFGPLDHQERPAPRPLLGTLLIAVLTVALYFYCHHANVNNYVV